MGSISPILSRKGKEREEASSVPVAEPPGIAQTFELDWARMVVASDGDQGMGKTFEVSVSTSDNAKCTS
jgi:hypothetical protein